MINNVVLVGRLTKDVDLRYTQNGIAVASFTLAVERHFKNAQGERETDFILCVMWRKAAENFAQFTRKGSLVGIEGGIQTRNYENQQGQRVYVTEVLVSNFSLLEPKSVTTERDASDPFASNQQQNTNYANNTNNNQQNKQPTPPINRNSSRDAGGQTDFRNKMYADNNSAMMNITDDDLPF